MNTREKLISRMPKGWFPSIDCGPGWDWILDDVEERLNYLDPNYEVHQVKEKFGTLRFYYTPTIGGVVQDIMDDVIRTAENSSSGTCEVCGNSDTRSLSSKGIKFDFTVSTKNNNGWYKTLCNADAEKLGYPIDIEDEE
jgi:hypothetical protein